MAVLVSGPVWRNRLKILVVLTLLALLPLRALAAVTIGFCALSDQNAAVHLHAEHADRSSHHGDTSPESQTGANPDCNVCAEHCTSASFAVPDVITAFLVGTGSDRTPHGERLAAGFVPEHLDPPPLAL
jgi:hypothetical protein